MSEKDFCPCDKSRGKVFLIEQLCNDDFDFLSAISKRLSAMMMITADQEKMLNVLDH